MTFVLVMLEALDASRSKSLKDCVLLAYESTLRPHHGFPVRATFNVAVKAAPSRKDFVAKLGADEELVFGQIRQIVPVFRNAVETNGAYLEAKGIEIHS